MPRSEARWRGLSDPACALPQRQLPRPLPAPSQCAPEPRSAVIRTQTASTVPTPSKFGGCSRLLSQPLPTAHPRQALWPRLQSRFSSGLYFYCLSIPSFLLQLWKGVPGPHAWHLPLQRGGKMDIWGPQNCYPLPAVTSRPPPPPPLHTLGFKLFASCLSGVGAAEKVVCQDNRIHIHFQGGWW